MCRPAHQLSLASPVPSHPCSQSHLSKGPAQVTLCQEKRLLWAWAAAYSLFSMAYPPGGETIPEPALAGVPVSSGWKPVQVTLGGWKGGWGGMSGMSWEVDPRPGHWLGWAEGCRQSAWEMVPSELILWDVQVSPLSVKVVGMAGWEVDIWARWDDDSGCPEGLFCTGNPVKVSSVCTDLSWCSLCSQQVSPAALELELGTSAHLISHNLPFQYGPSYMW